jgi:hypothetical protein
LFDKQKKMIFFPFRLPAFALWGLHFTLQVYDCSHQYLLHHNKKFILHTHNKQQTAFY